MKVRESFLVNFLLITFTGFSIPCFGQEISNSASGEVFVGSTPGDPLIKSLLAIPGHSKVDFIRWHLVLSPTKKNTFTLNLTFGEAQANTLGFKEGGGKRSLEGQYTMSVSRQKRTADIYHLKSGQLPEVLSLVRINANLLHLLTPKFKLMVGNGGWSYTLNGKPANLSPLPLPATLSSMPDDSARQMIFEGRTPCFPFAKDHHWAASDDCIKLKWKLILNKNSGLSTGGTYSMRRIINNEAEEVIGKWRLLRGAASSPQAVIYQLYPDKPGKAISLLAGDENVLFLLGDDGRLYTGNKDFSFTLNRRK